MENKLFIIILEFFTTFFYDYFPRKHDTWNIGLTPVVKLKNAWPETQLLSWTPYGHVLIISPNGWNLIIFCF